MVSAVNVHYLEAIRQAMPQRCSPSRSKPLFLVIALITSLLSAVPLSSADKGPTRGDPVIGERIAKAIVFDGRLWLRGAALKGHVASGGLISLAIKNNTRQVLFTDSVIDIATSGHDLWALRSEAAEHRFVLSAWRSGHFEDLATFPAAKGNEPIALFVSSGVPSVLSRTTILTLKAEDNTWHLVELRGEPRSGVQVAAASVGNGDSIYVGIDIGEWGGGLQRIDLKSGKVTDIERRDTKELCGGPLNKECDPVTGVIPDPQNNDCVLASIGLVHLSHSEGRILRVCGEHVDVVAELLLSGHEDKKWPNTKAIYGLAPSGRSGFWAITPGNLYYFSANGQEKREYALPKLESVSGIHLSRALPGVVVLQTDLNWAVSTSGYTPLVVSLEETSSPN
jgi:hypothetical protein